MINLRDYQQKAKQDIQQAFIRGKRRVLLIAPTGAGKTEIVASIIKDVADGGRRVTFLADRIVLVNQTSQRLWNASISHGVIQGQNSFNRTAPILIASQQTIEKRGYLENCDLVIIDEAHTQRRLITEILENSNIRVIGLTATPFSVGLGRFYDETVTCSSTRQLQETGWLVPIVTYIATQIDKTKLVMASGEYTAESSADAAGVITGDIVTEWISGCNREFGGPVKTLVYSPTVAYGSVLVKQFNNAGYNFRQVSYAETTESNKEAINSLATGEIDGLVSVEALVKGFDIPDIQCLVIARKYSSSLTSHIQLLGRGMRSCPEIGKTYCLVNDHVGNVPRFSVDTEAFWKSGTWNLNTDMKKKGRTNKERDLMEEVAQDRQCFKCGFFMPVQDEKCGQCGHIMKRKVKSRSPINIAIAAGKMEKYEPGLVKRLREKPDLDLWAVLSTIALRKHGVARMVKAEKLAKAMHKNLTGTWPAWGKPLDLNGKYDYGVEQIVEKQMQKFVRSKIKQFNQKQA